MGVFRKQMQDAMQLRRFSKTTQKTYLLNMQNFVKFHMTPPDQLTPEDIHAYMLYLINEKKLMYSSFNTISSAIRFFYNIVLHKNWTVSEIPYQKKVVNYPSF